MFDAALKATAQALGIRIPDYRFHKHSGQAVVTVFGRDVYLGVHGSVESRDKYERVISELVASRGVDPAVRARLKIQDLILLYWGHATQYYPGRTCESTIKSPLKRLRKWFADEPVATFGPLKLKAYRQLLLGDIGMGGRKLSRQYINECVAQVKAMIKWGVGEELVPPGVLHGLQSVDGLRWGRTTARETEPVKPVDDTVVEATVLKLCPTVADMVRVQRLSGMRPGEVCAMTVGEIDTSQETWIYRPRRHKTSHHGKTRTIPLGPRARMIIARYLTTDLTAPIFSPVRAVNEQKARKRAENRTPFTPSRLKRDRMRAKRPRSFYNRHYTPTNYAQAVRRACEDADVPAWTPNQLRHSRATELRRDFGLDAAGAVLGHSRLETTQIYAERNTELAVRVAEKTG